MSDLNKNLEDFLKEVSLKNIDMNPNEESSKNIVSMRTMFGNKTIKNKEFTPFNSEIVIAIIEGVSAGLDEYESKNISEKFFITALTVAYEIGYHTAEIDYLNDVDRK